MKKLILITNDDGVDAQGIGVLTQLMLPLGDVIVVAPDSARSGAACSITSNAPLFLHPHSDETSPEGNRCQVYSCNGTPVDCVKLAREQVCPRQPDLMVSGINHGDNASCSVHYSGTMGAVMEACIKEVPAIGFSLRTLSHHCDFTPYAEAITAIARHVLQQGLPQGVCLNVNFPEVSRLRGIRVCRQGLGDWRQEWAKLENPRGGYFYWMTGTFVNQEPECEDTDYWALDHGFAAVVPQAVDMTAYEALPALQSLQS